MSVKLLSVKVSTVLHSCYSIYFYRDIFYSTQLLTIAKCQVSPASHRQTLLKSCMRRQNKRGKSPNKLGRAKINQEKAPTNMWLPKCKDSIVCTRHLSTAFTQSILINPNAWQWDWQLTVNAHCQQQRRNKHQQENNRRGTGKFIVILLQLLYYTHYYMFGNEDQRTHRRWVYSFCFMTPLSVLVSHITIYLLHHNAGTWCRLDGCLFGLRLLV